MDASRKKIPTIDFRPRRQKRVGVLIAALLLLAGIAWWGWQWISPYDRAFVIEKQLDSVTVDELEPLIASLPNLEAPGYRVLFGALGHAQPEVRRAARTSLGALLDRWQRDPKQQPQPLAELTIMLAERASSFPEAARLESQDLFRRWVNLASPEKVGAEWAQREFHARRQLLEWVSEPRLAQPPRLRGQERAQRRAVIQDMVVNLSHDIGQSVKQLAASYATAPPTAPKNETKFQVVAVDHNPETDFAPAKFPGAAHEQGPALSGGLPNQPAQLSRGPNSEAQPITRLSAAFPANEPTRRPQASSLTSAELLLTDAPARYREASPAVRQQLRAEYQAGGIGLADLALLDLYASAPPAALGETINALPQRLDVEAQLWLRQFGKHPDSSVRRMAWSWLITSPDRATKQWLAERVATESDSDLREWYLTMAKQRKSR